MSIAVDDHDTAVIVDDRHRDSDVATVATALAFAARIRQDCVVSGSAKLLVAGAVVLAGLAVVLLKFLDGPATASPVVHVRKPEPVAKTETPKADAAPTVHTTHPTPEPTPNVAPSPAPERPAIAPPVLAPTTPNEDPIVYDDRGLALTVIDKPKLATALVSVDNKLRECIVKNGFTRGSGEAILRFIVAKHKDEKGARIVTESSSYEDEGTTIKDEKLLECMHKTAFDIVYPPAPKVGIPIWAKRKVVIENGMLRANVLVNLGRIRP